MATNGTPVDPTPTHEANPCSYDTALSVQIDDGEQTIFHEGPREMVWYTNTLKTGEDLLRMVKEDHLLPDMKRIEDYPHITYTPTGEKVVYHGWSKTVDRVTISFYVAFQYKPLTTPEYRHESVQ